MFKKLLLGTLVGVPLGAYFYHGFNYDYPIQQTKLPAQHMLYLQHIGSYNKLQDTFNILEKDFKELPGQKIPGGSIVGIYYDNPQKVRDDSRTRAAIGVLFDPSGKDIAKDFIKNRPHWSYAELPELSASGTKVPFRSYLTYMWVFYKIHPKLREYAQKQNIVQDGDRAPIFEVYRVQNDKVVDVESYITYGPGSENINLCELPNPPKK